MNACSTSLKLRRSTTRRTTLLSSLICQKTVRNLRQYLERDLQRHKMSQPLSEPRYPSPRQLWPKYWGPLLSPSGSSSSLSLATVRAWP